MTGSVASAVAPLSTLMTIADGAQTQHLGNYTFPVIRRLVDDIVTVTDTELVNAMQFFASRMKLVVEPTGCLGASAALQKKIDLRKKKVGVILSGGNIDPGRLAQLLMEAGNPYYKGTLFTLTL
jgi:threo-3-hydroxy-L-aspartate ammonia-lyase